MQAPALSAVLLSSLHFSLEDTGRSRSLQRAEFQYAVRETCQEPPRTRAAVPWSHGYGKPRARRRRWEKRWHPKEPAFPRSGDFRRAPGTKQKTEIAASETGAQRALPAASPAPSPTLHDARGVARTRAGSLPCTPIITKFPLHNRKGAGYYIHTQCASEEVLRRSIAARPPGDGHGARPARWERDNERVLRLAQAMPGSVPDRPPPPPRARRPLLSKRSSLSGRDLLRLCSSVSPSAKARAPRAMGPYGAGSGAGA